MNTLIMNWCLHRSNFHLKGWGFHDFITCCKLDWYNKLRLQRIRSKIVHPWHFVISVFHCTCIYIYIWSKPFIPLGGTSIYPIYLLIGDSNIETYHRKYVRLQTVNNLIWQVNCVVWPLKKYIDKRKKHKYIPVI